MNEENTRKLIERFSFIPRVDPLYPRDVIMPMSIDCKDGWFNLLWKLCEDIEGVLLKPENSRLREHFVVEQIKEKYASLRFSVSGFNDEIDLLINRAEYDSYHTCEMCGEPGTIMVRGCWYKTICENCKKIDGGWVLVKMKI